MAAQHVFSIAELRIEILKLRRQTMKSDTIADTDWFRACLLSRLSTSFIVEFEEHVIWDLISQHQHLDTELIRRFAHKINWRLALEYQDKLALEYPHLLLWARDYGFAE